MVLLLSAILGGVVALVLFKLWGGGNAGPIPPSLPLAQTRHTTIYIFPDGAGGLRVNAAPEILFVRPRDSVAWTVVDATGRASGNVSFRIKEGKSPFEQELDGFPRFTKARIRRDAFRDQGERVRYAILVNGEELFDPELQMEQ